MKRVNKPQPKIMAHGAIDPVTVSNKQDRDYTPIRIPASVSGDDAFAGFTLNGAKELRDWLTRAINYLESK